MNFFQRCTVGQAAEYAEIKYINCFYFLRIKHLNKEKADLNRELAGLDETLKDCEASCAEKRQGYAELKRKLEQKRAAERKMEHLQSKIRELEQSLKHHAGKESSLKNQIQVNMLTGLLS